MTTPRIRFAPLALLGAAVLLASPVQACDLDGLPGMFGSHRLNPFAGRMATVQPPAKQPVRPDDRSPQASVPPERDKETRREASSDPETERPKRLWESREGNGSISAEDKAIFN